MTRMQWLDMAQVEVEDRLNYDLIMAMSVTKWIHIHHLDFGLRRFFARVADCLSTGGAFILEAQDYKSYKHSLKVLVRGSQAHQNYAALRVMPDDFPWILTCELGLKGPFQIRARGKGIRQIDVYIQPPVQSIPQHCFDRRAALLALPGKEDPLSQTVDSIPWVPRDRKACV
ncbi:hypothetical protein CBS101457_001570 [Exobasidium rhododendri]|nr:hypothetical protein CBS101457_001570 [Exobasidium rhododendri]